MDWGAWWAAVCGVAQSRTRLNRLSINKRGALEPDRLAFTLNSVDVLL